MTDNTTLNPGSGGDTFAADDIASGVAAGAKVERIKVGFGADGSYTDVAQGAGLPVASNYLEVSGSVAANNANLISVDAAGYRWVSVHATTSISGFLLFQGSNDGTTWFNHFLTRCDAGSQDATYFTATANSLWAGTLCSRYFRVQSNSWSAGTESVTVGFSVHPGPPATAAARATGTNGTGDAQGLGNQVNVNSVPYVWNNSNFDRAKAVSQAKGTTGLGIPAAGVLGFDGTNYQAARSDSAGNLAVTPTPSASATGWTPASFTALSTAVQTVKASAGVIGGFVVFNASTAVCYIQVFDTAGAVTLGTTTPTYVLGFQAGAHQNVPLDLGIGHANGIKVAATTTPTGSTAPTTTAPVVTVLYK